MAESSLGKEPSSCASPRKVVPLTIDMITAGVEAFARWSQEHEEIEALVVEVYVKMYLLRPYQDRDPLAHSESSLPTY